MSRIHEALKKAELERTGSPIVATGGISPNLPAIAANGAARTVPTGDTHPIDIGHPAEADLHFRFEELLARRQAHASWNSDSNADVFSPAHDGHGAEEFRTLRSRLYQLRGNHPLRTLMVTSSIAGEGKTFVSSNLVRAIIRQTDRRVLAIDADLRCSRLHTEFGAQPVPGLSDYLRGHVDEPTIIQYGGEGNLCLIPSGSKVSDPSELLSNGRLKILLDRVGQAFDWIIIDAPPFLPVADARGIVNFCDGVLLVVRAGVTPSAVIMKARQELKGKNVVGVVLNGVADKGPAYGSYYGYGDKKK